MFAEIKVGPNVITVSRGRALMVSDLDGSIRGTAEQGLLFRDVRFLSHYRYRINGRKWKLVTAAPVSHVAARFEFTNPALLSAAGPVPRHVVGFRVERVISDGVHEDLDLVNYHSAPVRLTLEVELGSDFADLFEVRSRHLRIRREVRASWDEPAQRYALHYARDGYTARFVCAVSRSTTRARRHGHSLLFDLVLAPGGRWHACVDLIVEMDQAALGPASRCGPAPLEAWDAYMAGWRAAMMRVRSSDEVVARTLQVSAEDLVALLLDEQPPGTPGVLAAGVPWFVALFGRDSLIAGMQTLPLHRSFALGALAELARYQATASDDYRDADPGKIPHELRTGELARFGMIPHTPYYGSADATLLYPILLHEAYLWTGDRGLLATYLPAAERCLHWIDRYGDRDGDGFQEYRTRSPRGIKHQGWKDSGDGVVYGNGQYVEPPVALCELQGYVYDAKVRMAALYEEAGNAALAARLREEAGALYERFNAAFWLEDEGTYAYGLDAHKEPITSVVSNAGHCLWSGIVPPPRAARLIARLTADDMWSGWGIRTLSAAHPAFNPFAYQRGAVWPHDNAIIATGCRRYGDAVAAARIARGIFDAAERFQRYRLPELLSGLGRGPFGFPVQYLGANIPQAWAAGSACALAQVLLGLRADAPGGRLYVAPALPAWLDWIELENLQVGPARVALRCWREDGRSRVEVQDVAGPLRVVPAEEWAAIPARS
jgi:glycogen debranching enzyme